MLRIFKLFVSNFLKFYLSLRMLPSSNISWWHSSINKGTIEIFVWSSMNLISMFLFFIFIFGFSAFLAYKNERRNKHFSIQKNYSILNIFDQIQVSSTCSVYPSKSLKESIWYRLDYELWPVSSTSSIAYTRALKGPKEPVENEQY